MIDGLLFVFGRRAKQIRQNKVSELIHRSTAFPNLTQARVDIHFCEILDDEGSPDAYTVVPGSDLILSRTATKSNQSKYFINNRAATFDDIETLLATKGIDLTNNRFLILQGEVEQLALLPPKGTPQHEEGMLEYLEDIIGTSKYIPVLEEKEKLLEAKQEERTEKVNRVKVVEREKSNLEAAKLEAEEYVQTMKSINLKKAEAFALTSTLSLNSVADRIARQQEIATRLEEEGKSVQESQAELRRYDGLIKGVSQEQEELSRQVDKAKEEYAECQKSDAATREEMKQLRQAEKKASKKVEQETKKLATLERDVSANKNERETISAELEQHRRDLPGAEAELNALYEKMKGTTLPIQKELDEKQNKLIPVHERITELEQQIAVSNEQVETIQNRAKSAQQRYAETEKELAAVRTRGESAAKRRDELTKVAEKQGREYESAKAEAAQSGVLVKQLEDEVAQLQAQIAEQTRSVTEAQGKYVIRDRLIEAARRENVSGIYGRLGDLGSIAAEYDIAVTTAAPALDFIVVEDDRVGQWCADYLKRHKLGRTTFIMLNRIDGARRNMSVKKTFPPEAQRLFDLVTVADEKFRAAFYFALSDTLVTKDLATATRISRNKWKVVTLNGAVVSIRGTMSGGGKPKRGGMASKLASARLDETELRGLMELEKQKSNELTRARETLASAEETVERYRVTSQAATELQKLDLDLAALRQRAADLAAQLAELKPRCTLSEEDEERIREAKEKAARTAEERERLKESSAQAEQEVERLKNELMKAGGAQLTALKSRVGDLSKRIGQLEHDLTRNEAAETALQRGVSKAKKSIETSQGAVERVRQDIARAQEVLTKLEDSAMAALDALEGAKSAAEAKQQELSELVAQSDKFRKVVSKWTTTKAELSEELETHTRAIDSARASAEQWSKKAAACVEKAKEYAEMLEEAFSAPSLPTEGEVARSAVAALNQEVAVLEASVEKLAPNMAAIAEYKHKEQVYRERCAELEACTKERDALHAEYERVRKQRLDEFMEGFCAISLRLKEMYQMITFGGDAELELVDSLNPFAEGIVFSVRPPKKSWKNISNLSGGEKTLSSLALVFSLHQYKPTPLYVMDEIDAALDFKNVSIVANYIKERTKDAQFVIISLRNYMFELADQLVGIYKTNNCTKSATITPSAFVTPKPH